VAKEDQQLIDTFGKVLKQLREEQSISQEKLAFTINSHFTHISRLENGHKQPTLTMIFRLAEQLNLEPSQLIKKIEDELRA
jgi:transcriptional regulator with XRE-family HTH domain